MLRFLSVVGEYVTMAQYEQVLKKIAGFDIDFEQLDNPYQATNEIMIRLSLCKLYIARKINGRLRAIIISNTDTCDEQSISFIQTMKMIEDIVKGNY